MPKRERRFADELNFLLTNRIPRHTATRLMGWFSQIRRPWLARTSIALWRAFSDLDLSDARQRRFASLSECFTRELRPGTRAVDQNPDVLISPCDAIVGACGLVADGTVYQAKGFPYRVEDLFGNAERAAAFEGGSYVTLRLTATMYHRFHAPYDGCVEHVTYSSGDTWNVNPVALARVERLFCLNERAAISMRLTTGAHIALVAVAAILVASIRLHAADVTLHLNWRGPNEIPCSQHVGKGDELGWFQHGSTIIVFVPRGFALADGIAPGARIRMGQTLLRSITSLCR